MTVPSPYPWSFSALTQFETCPKQYYHQRVAKDVGKPVSEASIWGNVVHKHIEERLANNVPLPSTLAGLEKVVAPIANKPGEKLVERQLAVDDAFVPVTWESTSAWCRAIVDVGVITDDKALLLDWKTGKRKPVSAQLKLSAALAFSHYPKLEVVYTGFVWLRDGKVDKETVTRGEVSNVWVELCSRVSRMERAFEEDSFPAKPSGLCLKYCPVPRSKCKFSGLA